MIARVEDMPGSAEAKNHWRGIGRFFRALEYSDLARAFGDVPWYDKEILPSETEQSYKARDPLQLVATKIMEDFNMPLTMLELRMGHYKLTKILFWLLCPEISYILGLTLNTTTLI